MNTPTWTQVRSALVSGVITAVLAGAGYIIGVGDIFGLNFHSLANVTAISFLVAIVSLVKAVLTTPAGNFAGFVAIK
jgi:hypothetical protein